MAGVEKTSYLEIPSIDGLEELNLVEFPLAILSDAQVEGKKTLEFVDTIEDRKEGKTISRKVTITGADAWGLPNWQDMDVLLALMQITYRKNGFSERTVRFSLYELRRCLDLPNDGRTKQRLKLSLKRLVGVTVAYENAWRRKGKWVSLRAFHLLDEVQLTNTVEDRDPDEEQLFKWSDTVVESVSDRNTKPLNWNFYLSLERPATKRLYRFLDKRFYLNPSWTYDLPDFCQNKLGMAAYARPDEYKRTLWPAIEELQERGVLEKMGKDVVFKKVGKGRYSLTLTKKGRDSDSRVSQVRIAEVEAPTKEPDSPLVGELVQRGVNRVQAIELVLANPDECGRQIEYFDFQVKQGWKPAKSSGGYVRTAILGAYAAPDGFKPREAVEQEEAARKKKTAEKQKAKQIEDAKLAADRREFKRQEELVKAYREKIGEDSWKDLILELASTQEGFHRQYFLSSEYEQVLVVFHSRLR